MLSKSILDNHKAKSVFSLFARLRETLDGCQCSLNALASSTFRVLIVKGLRLLLTNKCTNVRNSRC